jgi:hypothetical protein
MIFLSSIAWYCTQKDLPAIYCLCFGFLVGILYSIRLFGISTIIGTSDYWEFPAGTVDLPAGKSAYYWFVQQPWTWPILHLTKPNPPEGANAYLFDSGPAILLAGSVASALRGYPVNPYPFWLALTFGFNSAALVGLVRSLGQRTLFAAFSAAILAALMPSVHHRFGHLLLLAHFLVVIPLAVWISAATGRLSGVRAAALLAAMPWLAVFVHMYLWAMTAAIGLAAILHLAIDRHIKTRTAFVCSLFLLISAPILLWLFDTLQALTASASSARYGSHSMNLMSPWWPQTSAFGRMTGLWLLTRGSIGGTTGQYEGYNYLGLGVLFLLFITALHFGKQLVETIRRWYILFVLMCLFSLFAVSNDVYFGQFKILTIPLPDLVTREVFGRFRSSGRFFWPVGWLLVAIALAGVLTALRPGRAIMAVLIALMIQWTDLGWWRERIETRVLTAPSRAFGSETPRLEEAMRARDFALGYPGYFCGVDSAYEGAKAGALMELQLRAARLNVSFSGVLLAQMVASCGPLELPRNAAGRFEGMLLVMAEASDHPSVRRETRDLTCRPVPVGLVCLDETIDITTTSERPEDSGGGATTSP